MNYEKFPGKKCLFASLSVMGNVLATSKPITSAANQFLGANPETSISPDGDSTKNAPGPLENPGTMEELHKKCKGE